MADLLTREANFAIDRVLALIAANPELQEDDELRRDMLDGETDLRSIASRLAKRTLVMRGLSSGVAETISDLQARKARFDRADEALTDILRRLVLASGETKLVLPEATLSLSKARQSVSIVDADAIPQGYFIRTPDKAAIKSALEADEDVPGAALVLGHQPLSVRVR